MILIIGSLNNYPKSLLKIIKILTKESIGEVGRMTKNKFSRGREQLPLLRC